MDYTNIRILLTMEVPIWGFVTGIVVLLGGVSTSVALLGRLTAKAAKEAIQQTDIDNLKEELKHYVRNEVFEAVKKDMEGIGRKVSHLQSDYNSTAKKVIEIESTLVAELKNLNEGQRRIETLLQGHIEKH